MNSSIGKAIRKRNHIHYRTKSTNNPDHLSQYRHLRNDVIRLVREAKTEYRNKLTSQLMDKSIPPDRWWRIAKSVCKLNKCNKVSPPIKHEGRIIIHTSEKCDIFNKYFADISNIENEPNLPNEDFTDLEIRKLHLSTFFNTFRHLIIIYVFQVYKNTQ